MARSAVSEKPSTALGVPVLKDFLLFICRSKKKNWNFFFLISAFKQSAFYDCMWFQLQQNPWLSFDVSGVVVSCFFTRWCREQCAEKSHQKKKTLQLRLLKTGTRRVCVKSSRVWRSHWLSNEVFRATIGQTRSFTHERVFDNELQVALLLHQKGHENIWSTLAWFLTHWFFKKKLAQKTVCFCLATFNDMASSGFLRVPLSVCLFVCRLVSFPWWWGELKVICVFAWSFDLDGLLFHLLAPVQVGARAFLCFGCARLRSHCERQSFACGPMTSGLDSLQFK